MLHKETKIYEKSTFSMINSDTKEFLKAHSDRKSAVIFGIEAHVCV